MWRCGCHLILGTSQVLYWSIPLTKYCSGDEIKNNEMGGSCVCHMVRRTWHVFHMVRWAGHVCITWETWGVHSGFWWGDLRERALGRDGHSSMDSTELDLQELGLRGTGSNWLRTRTDGRCLYMYQWTFGFNKMWGISWIADSFSVRALLHRVSEWVN